MNENAKLVRTLFDAFEHQDLATIEASLADDVQSHTPGTSRLAGTAEGRQAVLAQLGRARQLSAGTYRIEVEDVLGGDLHAALDRHWPSAWGSRSPELDRALSHAAGAPP